MLYRRGGAHCAASPHNCILHNPHYVTNRAIYACDLIWGFFNLPMEARLMNKWCIGGCIGFRGSLQDFEDGY